MVVTFITAVFATIILCPFIVTLLQLIIFKKMGKAPVSVLGSAADITTPFLLLSVSIISREIFGKGIGFVMITIFIVVTIVFAIYERMHVKEFLIGRLLKKIWRMYFLLLLFSYIVLLFIGIILKIIEKFQ